MHPIAQGLLRSIPQLDAARSRETPSSTIASASIRRAAAASLLLAAARRSPAASRPNRVIATALMTRPHICRTRDRIKQHVA